MADAGSATHMTDDDLQQMLRRTLRLVVILGVLLAIVFTITLGWQSGLLELAGAVISYTGIREYRTLSMTIFAQLDQQKPPRPVGRTFVMFFLRLAGVGLILYVSLKCLNGTVYALVAGIGLAVVALSWEALRQLRG